MWARYGAGAFGPSVIRCGASVNTDRYQKITTILREALALPEPERAAFIDERCGGDLELRDQVRAHLAGQDQRTIAPGATPFNGDAVSGERGEEPGGRSNEPGADRTYPDYAALFETPPADGLSRHAVDSESAADDAERIASRRGALFPTAAPTLAGRRLAKYDILEVLGEGGMGMVYLARQANPSRTVALKVIRPGLLTPRLLRRFEHESHVLGLLQHPGIAQIYEAGAADAGSGLQPFFAMEYVKGLPLTDYADSKGLDVERRLELFVRVCEAVHHAHQKGVIHRDLKPGNILVVEDAAIGRAQPKVLDFGVARATDQDLASATMQTDAGQLVGTIPYMSPEQVSGRPGDMDTRSDVYALGVILYELLSGKLPYEVTQKTIPEAVRIIGLEEPTPLGLANRTLKGDLQTIAAKALEKDKERRYQSAHELSLDVGRYLRDEPISARPPSSWYQFTKFAARNRALVGGVAAAFLLLCLGIAGTAWQAAEATAGRELAEEQGRIAREAERRARDDSETAQRINNFLIGMLGALNPEEAQGEIPTLQELIDRAAADIGDQFADRPAVEIGIRETLGHTYMSLSLFEDAMAQYNAILDVCRREWGGSDRQTLNARRNVVGALSEMGRYDESEPMAREVIAGLESAFGPDDADAASARMELARILQETGRMAEAEPLFRESIEVLRRHPDRIKNLATAMHNLGTALKDSAKYEEGIAILRETLKLRLDTVGPNHPDTFFTKNSLAAALLRAPGGGYTQEGEALIRETLDDRTRVLGPDHSSTITTASNLAVTLIEQKRLDEALPLAERAYEAWQTKLGDQHPKTVTAMANLAYLYEDLSRLEEAERLYRRAVEISGRTKSRTDPETWSPINNLAMLLVKQGELEEAESLYRELLDRCDGVVPRTHPYFAIFQNNFGECLTLVGKYEEAQANLEESRTNMAAVFPEGHPRLAKAQERLDQLSQRRAAK